MKKPTIGQDGKAYHSFSVGQQNGKVVICNEIYCEPEVAIWLVGQIAKTLHLMLTQPPPDEVPEGAEVPACEHLFVECKQ